MSVRASLLFSTGIALGALGVLGGARAQEVGDPAGATLVVEAPQEPVAQEPVAQAPVAQEPAAQESDASPLADAEPAYRFRLGLDLYTRFLWRGVSFGEQWTLQPSLAFETHGFSVNLWASAAPDQSSLVDYVGITLAYSRSFSFGSFSVSLADWIFTQRYRADGTVETGAPYLFDFDGGGNGSHWLDLTVAFTGPDAFPITLQFGAVVYNDPDHSLYAGVLYPIDVGAGFTLTPEFGVVFGRSARWYITDSDPVNVTNCALTLSRVVELGHGLTLPVSLALVVNPEAERVHVVAGLGLRL